MTSFSLFNMVFGTPSTASCRHVQRTVQSYLDNELSEHDAQRVSAHLRTCKRCGLDASAYRSIKKALHKRADVDPQALGRLRDLGESLGDTDATNQ